MSEVFVLPSHIGIIMDGNGRWAKARGMPRTTGHKEGLNTAKRIVKAASQTGVQFLTLYTFSTENWKRAQDEVSFLMRLIQQHLRKEYQFYKDNNIKVVHSGDISALPRFAQKEIGSVMEDTRDFQGMTLNLAINYGGRDEICRAFNRWLRQSDGLEKNQLTYTVKPDDIRYNLDRPELPDTDLIIRTGGEQRTSNFLLWQSAYAELYFSDTLWPDYNEEEFRKALAFFDGRERRFGNA